MTAYAATLTLCAMKFAPLACALALALCSVTAAAQDAATQPAPSLEQPAPAPEVAPAPAPEVAHAPAPATQPVALPTVADSYRGDSTDSDLRWSAADEHFYRRNRRFATAGKIITVVGRALVLGLVASGSTFEDGDYWGAVLLAGSGELMWSGADMRASIRLREAGANVRLGAPITSLVGALTLAPLTWIAGPIASAHIRHGHEDLMAGPGFAMNSGSRLDVRGASLSFEF